MNIIRRPFRYAYGNAVLVLIALNLLAFLGQSAFPRLTAYMALNPVNVLRAGAFWQFVSYMFAHGSVSHLLVNMLGLFFFIYRNTN